MHRRKPVGTATSAAPSSGTSVQPSRRAARAGYSAVRSGDEVKIALSTSPGSKPLASRSAPSSSSVASRIASLVFAVVVVAPRRPRRILVMALVDQLRLMVITDPVLLKGRDAVGVLRQAVAGGATMVQVRWKDGTPDEAARAPATADYWSVGPCFATPTKSDAGPPLGPEGFTALARLAPEGTPVIGIGGITAANARAIVAAGAAGVAVIGGVLGAADPEESARRIRDGTS